MSDAHILARLLADPGSAASVRDWSAILSTARATSLTGTLAWRLTDSAIPEKIASILEVVRRDLDSARSQALWEAEMARRALAPLGVPVILLKGSAYAAAGLDAGLGRSIGDLDILVPREALDAVQEALLAAGWEWVKEEDEYDDLYYRRWMHELPPLIHKERDRMIDVHHTILPLTARLTPDAVALIEDSVILESGLRVLSPPDMVIHSAAHLFADGDMAGGLRNLWDIDRLVREFADEPDFWKRLRERAGRHQLDAATGRALRLATRLFGTPVEARLAGPTPAVDALFERRLLARNGWGQATRPFLRFAFYVRSHWLRMPPLMLARHLWIKWRRPKEKSAPAAT